MPEAQGLFHTKSDYQVQFSNSALFCRSVYSWPHHARFHATGGLLASRLQKGLHPRPYCFFRLYPPPFLVRDPLPLPPFSTPPRRACRAPVSGLRVDLISYGAYTQALFLVGQASLFVLLCHRHVVYARDTRRPFVNGAEEQKPTLQRSRSASVQPSTVHRPRRPRSHGGRPIHKRDISGPVLQVDSTTYVQWASDDDLLPPPTPEVRQLIESDRAGRERAVKPLWPSDAHAHATSRHHQVSAAQKTRQQGRTSHSRDYDAKPLPSLPLRRPPLATVPPKSDKEHAQGLSSGTREPLRVYNPPVHQSSSQDQLDAAAHRSASDPHFTLSQPRPVNVQPGYKPFLQRSLTSPSVSPVDREPHGDAAMPRSANAVMQGAKHVAEQTVYMPPKQRRIHEDAYGYSKSEEHLVYEPPTTQRFNPFLPVPAKAASAGSVESKQGRTSPKIRPQPGSRSPSEQGISTRHGDGAGPAAIST